MDNTTAAHQRFLDLTASLHGIAAKRGDDALSDATAACLIEASGGNPACPIGALFLDDFMDDDWTLPCVPAGRHALANDDAPEVDAGAAVEHVHRTLRGCAELHHDQRFIAALSQCAQRRGHDAGCPIHRMLHGSQEDGHVG